MLFISQQQIRCTTNKNKVTARILQIPQRQKYILHFVTALCRLQTNYDMAKNPQEYTLYNTAGNNYDSAS